MKTLFACGGFILLSIVPVTGQHSAKYMVRNKPIAILDKPEGNVLALVPKNKSVTLSSYDKLCDCFTAKYLDFEGVLLAKPWLEDIYGQPSGKNRSKYTPDDSIKRLLTEYRLANDEEDDADFTVEKAHVESESNLHKTIELISKWGYTDGKRIAEGKIWLGMTVEMTLESWGIPYRVNRSNGTWGIREQWIYSEAYLYFENGTLAEIFRVKPK
jgi:hypothetical protein